MTHRIQTSIFPDRFSVAVMNPQNGEFLPVQEIRDMLPALAYDEWMRPGAEGRYRTLDGAIRSSAGETLEEFAKHVAKFFSPFEKMRPADYTRNLFD